MTDFPHNKYHMFDLDEPKGEWGLGVRNGGEIQKSEPRKEFLG